METQWPEWWNWEPDLSLPHLGKRMIDRGFNEVDLLTMLEEASGYHPGKEEGRFEIETRFEGRPWLVIVEPLPEERVLLVITGYQDES
jgi:hypothetical protein